MDLSQLWIAVAGVLGLMVGSFANVCVHRIPRGESVVRPRSRCPACGAMIAWYDNLPLFSWLLLRGRCRHCGSPISIRYPLLEALMGLSWAGLAWQFGPTLQSVEAIVLVTLLWILTMIDLETFLLPNVLTFPGIAGGLLFSGLNGTLVDAAIGAVAGYGIFWLVARLFYLVTRREGMGYGDFKLLAMLGAFMGWQALPFIVLLSSVSGAIIGTVFLLLARRGIRTEIPFGPYLALAGMIWFLWGAPILGWYGGLTGMAVQ